MHFSSPSHPLIYSFLLRREQFQGTERLIVETREQGEKLLSTFEALELISPSGREYRLIVSLADIVETLYDTSLIGIFPVEALEWKVDKKDIVNYCLELASWASFDEEKLITWLSEHGYIARKSDEIGTYFRVGDTVSIPTKKDMVRVSFFGTKIEEIYLDETLVPLCRIMTLLG